MYVITQLEKIRQTALDMQDTTSENDSRHDGMATIIVLCDDLIALR